MLLALISTVGCANPWGRLLTDAAAGAGGGRLASELSKGDPGYTALGTVAGIGAAEGARAWKLSRDKKAEEATTQRRRGQETKETYFQQQERHRPKTSSTLQVPVPLPERVTQDGVRLEPATQWIEIHQ
ncbi:MAG: hypothetical protein JNN07_02845 [Verrucomicrobiales bacterium]|nr:hypothetical protein [Verrucomicrobiales bacterium]